MRVGQLRGCSAAVSRQVTLQHTAARSRLEILISLQKPGESIEDGGRGAIIITYVVSWNSLTAQRHYNTAARRRKKGGFIPPPAMSRYLLPLTGDRDTGATGGRNQDEISHPRARPQQRLSDHTHAKTHTHTHTHLSATVRQETLT